MNIVEIVNGVALVDSRTYCSEVIKVNHRYWIQNILKAYQDEIEERFGQVCFKNTYVEIPNGGKKETVYALLAEAQINACLVLSRNSVEVRIKKLDLIAEFEEAKNHIKRSLERTLSATVEEPEVKPYEERFPITLDKLKFDSGIVSRSQVRDTIVNCGHFQHGIDWRYYDKKHILITIEVYTILMVCFRSKLGAIVEDLPETISISRDKLFGLLGISSPGMNRRLPKSN